MALISTIILRVYSRMSGVFDMGAIVLPDNFMSRNTDQESVEVSIYIYIYLITKMWSKYSTFHYIHIIYTSLLEV